MIGRGSSLRVDLAWPTYALVGQVTAARHFTNTDKSDVGGMSRLTYC
jgi:hypothetical protein